MLSRAFIWGEDTHVPERCQEREVKLFFCRERRAHAPRLAGAEVTHGFEVVVTGNHRKEPASWGCHVAACVCPAWAQS